MRVPSSTPGGMLTDSVRSRVVRPEPLHGRTRILDHLAAALADRTGALQREEAALGVADAAVAVAVLAGLRLGAGLGAGAGAGFAGHRGRQPHLRVLAGEGLLQRDLHVEAQVRAALAARAALARAAHAENAFEDVGEGRAEIVAEAVRAAAHALLEGGMAEAVIGGALVAVFQDVIGLVDFLELGFAILVAGIAVGMKLHRELAIRDLHVGFGRSSLDAQHFVVAALRRRRHLALARLHRRAVPALPVFILNSKPRKQMARR